VAHFSTLQNELSAYLDEEKIEVIHQAYKLAAQAHKGQHRQSGDPYITHPIAVATILCKMQMDYQSIAAAILHDVTEDTPIENPQIVEQFGSEIAKLVEGVSKLTHIPFENQAQAQAENFRKMTLAMVRDIRVILIKLADRLHNMRTMEVMPANKKSRIARETLEIYAPIASRLGMHNLSTELEELCFVTLYPLRYRVLQEAIRKINHTRRNTISHIETCIRNRFEEMELPPCAVWHRQSHLYTIYQNMQKQRSGFYEVANSFDFRIVTDKPDTCYRALGALHQLYKPLPKHFKDYIALPKANGYQALHTTLFGPHGVPINIQIHTADMDNVSENGITAFGFYKPIDNFSDTHIRASQWLKGLMEIQKNTASPLEFIENVKTDLFPAEIYVFTPLGKIMELPHGATLIDFAYAVHSDIGNNCIAAKIDRKLAPLSTNLLNGQTVEIITSPDATPQQSWLNFVATGKARSNIRHALKEKKHADSIALGKKLLENALCAQGTPLEKIPKNKIRTALSHFQYKKIEALYQAIGLGKQIAPLVAQRFLNEIDASNTELATESEPYSIEGSEGMVVIFAECCRPIPKDPIAGVFMLNKGLTVHHDSCKNLNKWRHRTGRYITLNWSNFIAEKFKVEVDIEVNNWQGIVADIAAKIAEEKVNIDDICVGKRDDYYGIIHLLLSVQDRLQLAKVMRRIRLVKGVIRINRSKP
jgi:GTP diphosphokinase / guanosine-3',5'-bis(diphosphate) 3'-diphosphatase